MAPTPEASPLASQPWLRHYDFWVPAHLNYPRQSVYQVLMIGASQFHDRPAYTFQGTELTFGELKNRADRLATALAALGVSKGDRVGIMLANCPEFSISFFAILRLGAIVVSLNPGYTEREIAFTVRDSGLRVVIAREASFLSGLVETVITLEPGPRRLADLVAAAGGPVVPRAEIDPENDVAVLQYTGGTTGAPKGAMLTHYNLYANLIQVASWNQHWVKRGEESQVLVLPMFHVYGQQSGILLACWNGSHQILMAKFDIHEMIENFRRFRPSYFSGVPTLYISLLNHPGSAGCGLERMKLFGSGSAPLPLDVIRRFEQLSGAMLREGYGLSEASPTTHITPLLGRRKPGSIGLPVPDTECRIVDLETGERDLGANADGELLIRGPQVMKGYWNRLDDTALSIRNGWLYTGDVARMDEDGYFYIVQRKKDMILVKGFNVYPGEVEEALFEHPAVMEAAVIGTPDEYRGEAVKAFVVLKPGAKASGDDLAAHCRERLAKYKMPSSFVFRDALPKSGVGKVLRRVLREGG